MKKALSFILLSLFVAVLALPVEGRAASLLEVYQQALQSDPRIHEAEARRLAALEAEPQARGLYLPQLSASGDWTRSNTDGSGTINQFVEVPPGSGNLEVVPIPTCGKKQSFSICPIAMARSDLSMSAISRLLPSAPGCPCDGVK